MVDENKKKKKGNTETKKNRRCKSCSLDCSVIRDDLLENIPISERKEQSIALFGSEFPTYTAKKCPKK